MSIQSIYLNNLKRNKTRLQDIQTQLTTQSKINNPSDNPLGNSKVMRFGNHLGDIDTYYKNINSALDYVNNTITPMEGIQSEMDKIMVDLTQVNDATVDSNLNAFAQKIDLSLDTIMEFANSEYNGRYVFSGNDNSQKPFGYNASGDAVEAKLSDIGGEHKIRVSKSNVQKVNVTGKEVFQTVFGMRGNLDSSSAVGSVQTNTTQVLDPDGNEYTLTTNYTKTAANTYDFTYSLEDSSATVVDNGAMNDMVFNASTGELDSIDGNPPSEIRIQSAANNIDIIFDQSNMREEANSTSLNVNKNQETDIFNTLISVRDNLNNGIKPNENQVKVLKDFNNLITDKLSEVGNISNKLSDTKELLESQQLQTERLMSEEKDVDVAEAIVDLQTQQFNLDLTYKVSAMILPKSLLDYL